MACDILSENATSTFVAHYERPAIVAEEGYQTEADLERPFIEQLQRQGYEYAQIPNEDELISNLLTKLEELNNYHFTAKRIGNVTSYILEHYAQQTKHYAQQTKHYAQQTKQASSYIFK